MFFARAFGICFPKQTIDEGRMDYFRPLSSVLRHYFELPNGLFTNKDSQNLLKNKMGSRRSQKSPLVP
jgi:hypothetical protein